MAFQHAIWNQLGLVVGGVGSLLEVVSMGTGGLPEGVPVLEQVIQHFLDTQHVGFMPTNDPDIWIEIPALADFLPGVPFQTKLLAIGLTMLFQVTLEILLPNGIGFHVGVTTPQTTQVVVYHHGNDVFSLLLPQN